MSPADDERDTPPGETPDEVTDEMTDAPPPLAWPTDDPTSVPPTEASAPDEGAPDEPAPVLPAQARAAASGWTGRLIAGAAGAGVVLAALALRDVSPLRRTPAPAKPPSWRRRAANWLRSQDR